MVNRRRAHSRQARLSELTTGRASDNRSSQWAYFNPTDSDWSIDQLVDMSAQRWMSSARCRDLDPDLFYATEGRMRSRELSAICASCPVIAECLDWAIEQDEFGWWGGLPRSERNNLQAFRQRQKEALGAPETP